MPERNIYLRIETIDNYSPVEPQTMTPPTVIYRRDGMRNMGHEDGMIPDAEVQARTMTAVVYREYVDPDYLIPKTSKIIAADLNEPAYDRRIPGTVIYAHPGDTLKIHLHNADSKVHSFHVHGIEYGIDSDGAWPMGTQATDGRRSDEICPGQNWTYTFNITQDMLGAWPFHDHSRHTDASVKRGLFGAIIVRGRPFKLPIPITFPPGFEKIKEQLRRLAGGRPIFRDALPPLAQHLLAERYEFLHDWLTREMLKPRFFDFRLHAPVFFHQMSTEETKPLFDSGDLEELGVGTYSRPFNDPGTFAYFCRYHPMMQGIVEVIGGGLANATVNILDAPAMGFYPASVQVAPGATVTWVNQSQMHHTVSSQQGANMPTHCINGRGFVGNSPTILARAGRDIRWYVFNLDFGQVWHNFHPHSIRWKFANETIDVRSMGPAESFIVDTKAPPVILLPGHIAAIQPPNPHPPVAVEYRLVGDFVFHCHVHHHMMNGMVGVVRSYQDVWLTPSMKQELEDTVGIHLFDPANPIPDVDPDRCGRGTWEELGVAPEVTFMHACLLPNTGKVLYWGYTDTNQSRLFNPAGPAVTAPANQPATLPGLDANLSDLWSAEHTFLSAAAGTLLAHGGLTNGPPTGGPVRAFLFNAGTETWSETGSTAQDRFYATTLTLADGKALTICGSGSKSIEVYDPGAGTWGAPISLLLPDMVHHQYYPWTYLLPDGKLFIAGPHVPTQRFDWTPAVANLESFPTIGGNRSTGGEKGTSVLLPLRPPNYEPKVIILGGNTATTEKTAEMIDLSVPTPTWTPLPDLNVARPQQVNSVLLPDGRVFVAGGVFVGTDGGPSEIFDPANPAAGWELGATMTHKRGYHSAMILLADGSILAGGDPNSGVFERFFPAFYFQPRPVITSAPAAVAYGTTFSVDTPQAPLITEAILMRPGAVTHGFNMSQRAVQCTITGGTATSIALQAPPNSNVGPPGWYLLFILDANRFPSVGRWIRLS